MNRGDALRQMNNEQMAAELCKLYDQIENGCDYCIGTNMCVAGDGKANGLRKWLDEEVNDKK